MSSTIDNQNVLGKLWYINIHTTIIRFVSIFPQSRTNGTKESNAFGYRRGTSDLTSIITNWLLLLFIIYYLLCIKTQLIFPTEFSFFFSLFCCFSAKWLFFNNYIIIQLVFARVVIIFPSLFLLRWNIYACEISQKNVSKIIAKFHTGSGWINRYFIDMRYRMLDGMHKYMLLCRCRDITAF